MDESKMCQQKYDEIVRKERNELSRNIFRILDGEVLKDANKTHIVTNKILTLLDGREEGGKMTRDELKEIAEVWPPATFIVEEMKARKWNNSTLSKKSGRTTQRIKELLAGAEIGLNDADGLGRAFGTSKLYWLNLQDIFTKSLKQELHKESTK
jgi:plasmid maintenance system antidote protein VapI